MSRTPAAALQGGMTAPQKHQWASRSTRPRKFIRLLTLPKLHQNAPKGVKTPYSCNKSTIQSLAAHLAGMRQPAPTPSCTFPAEHSQTPEKGISHCAGPHARASTFCTRSLQGMNLHIHRVSRAAATALFITLLTALMLHTPSINTHPIPEPGAGPQLVAYLLLPTTPAPLPSDLVGGTGDMLLARERGRAAIRQQRQTQRHHGKA